MKTTKIISLLIALAIAFNFSGCRGAKNAQSENTEIINHLPVEDNRTVITNNKIAVSLQYAISVSGDNLPGGNYITSDLEDLMTQYEGQDVWFRVFFSFTDLYGMDALYEENKEKYTDYKDFVATYIEAEINYAKEIGALNIVREMSSDAPKDYAMEVTAEMINKIFERGTISFDIASPARIEGYSEKISDTLTDYLSKMDETQTVEVAAVTVYDTLNLYAGRQNIGYNERYNQELNKKFRKGTGKKLSESNAVLEATIEEIMMRNNILQSRVLHEGLPYLGFKNYDHTDLRIRPSVFNECPIGFNAVLTKSEILKLAEDEEIKVIYLAPQE